MAGQLGGAMSPAEPEKGRNQRTKRLLWVYGFTNRPAAKGGAICACSRSRTIPPMSS